MQVTLLYTESSVTYSRSFTLFAIKGMDEPDRLHKMGVVHNYLDGGLEEQVRGFRKEPITLSFAPPFVPLDTRFLTSWFTASRKWIVYGTYLSEGITDDELASKWLYDLEYGRTFDVDFFDEHVYYEWKDEGPEADADMYCKLKVKITGTSLSPQTFTTGTAPLDNPMVNGENWPIFNSSTSAHTVVLTPTSNCQFIPCLVGNPVVSAGDVQFQAFVSDMQVPDPADGFYYMDVKIFLQAIP